MGRSIVVIAGLTTISLSLFLVQAAPAKEKLNVIMNFTIEGQHAPWFVAKSNGYFDAAGLDVTIQRGYGSADTVKKVLTGVADIGFADPVPIIMAVAEGQPVKAIMGGYMQEPCALYSTREGANITSPKQMEGKTIGGPAGDICIILLAAVMERAGADFSKVTVQNMDAATRIPMLAAGRIDALGSFYEKDVLVANGLKAAGKSSVSWHYDKYINKYSAMVVTSGKMIEGKPDVLRKLVAALVRGYQDTVKDPTAAGEVIMKMHPEFDRSYILSSAQALMGVMWDDTTRAKGIGMLDTAKMQQTIDITAKYWKLPTVPKPEQIFINDFVSAAHQSAK
jgi:NitT/TauT family transport system substrate-binding protein